MPPGRVNHGKQHDMANPFDHKGDIFDGLTGSANPITAANYVVELKKLTDTIAALSAGLHWQPNIIDFHAMVTSEPVTPTDGDRYISTEAGTIPSTTQAVLVNDVCQWDAGTSLWVISTPDDGWAVVEDGVDPNKVWIFDGTNWNDFSSMLDHAGLLNLDYASSNHTGFEPTISPKNSAFNKAFGSSAGSVTEGDKAALLAGRSGGQTISGGDVISGILNLKSKVLQTAGVRVADGAKVGIGFDIVDADPTEVCEVKSGNLKFVGTGGRTRNMSDPALPQDGDTQAARDAAIGTHTAISSAHHTKYTDAESRAAIGDQFDSTGKALKDLDMNSKDILNAGDVGADSVTGTLTNSKVESTLGDVILKAADAAGAKKISFRNNVGVDGTEVAHVDTLGKGTFVGVDVGGVAENMTDPSNPQEGVTKNYGDTTYEPIISPKNSAFNKAFGTGAGTVCQGNDARLSDTRNIASYRQAAEPTLGADDDIAIWVDTDDSNKTYLVFRVASGTQVKVVMT